MSSLIAVILVLVMEDWRFLVQYKYLLSDNPLDKRESRQQISFLPQSSSPVTHIHSSALNKNYLITGTSSGLVLLSLCVFADISAKISYWDLRKCSSVLSFSYPNSYNYKTRFSLNETEDILAVGGQDKKISFWDSQSGKKLHEIVVGEIVSGSYLV